MWSRALATRTETRVLAGACAAAGAVSLGTAAVPFSDTAPTELTAALGVLGLVLAALLRAQLDRCPRALVHAVLLIATGGVTACVAASTTAAGPAVTACSYYWIALYAATFLSRRALLAHAAAVAIGLAWGLAEAGAPSAPQTWGFLVVTLGAVAGTVHVLVGRLRVLAQRDPLTGLVTRSAFTTTADQVMHMSARSGAPLTLALIDLDDFKIVNDQYGHAHGDALLVALAAAWRRSLRRGDVLGRHGGDEFVLLMPGTTEEGAEAVVRRLREAQPQTGWTAGVAAWDGESLAEWLARADLALYAQKRARRPRDVELRTSASAARPMPRQRR